MRKIVARVGCVAALTMALGVAAFSSIGSVALAFMAEDSCTDGLDGDGDNLIDCADPFCSSDPACEFATGCCVVDVVPATCDPNSPNADFCVSDLDQAACAAILGGPLCSTEINLIDTDCDVLQQCGRASVPAMSYRNLVLAGLVLLAAGGLLARKRLRRPV